MGQFGKILKFELKGYLTNKVFVGVTVFLMVVLALVLFFPRAMDIINGASVDEPGPVGPGAVEPGTPGGEGRDVMLVSGGNQEVLEALSQEFAEYEVRETADDVKDAVAGGKARCAVAMDGLGMFTYYVDDLSMYDENAARAADALTRVYRLAMMRDAGLADEQARDILTAEVVYDIQSLGVDQGENFFYTYIMIFALYMVILLYGQMVATNVATEKSSRAMELLVTSAKPTSMMFGKVLASCAAGFIQLLCVFGSAILFYNMNKPWWGDNPVIGLIFDMPPELLGYMLVYFILGFLLYAFMYGAIGSTASKLEDINTSAMPVTLLFIAGFMVVVIGMTSGNIDNTLMRVCSYVPFTSPMAMFTRIAMSKPAVYEIALSIAVLAASCFGVGVVSAKIYRVGVLLYGGKPKLGDILRAIKKA